jgi:peptide-methionine (S)-S-oxide reductase
MSMKSRNLLIVLCLLASTAGAAPLEKATFAGGCFWCMEPPFEKLAGVASVISGYTGGTRIEAVEIVYDPARVSYETLLEVFWRNIDPTNPRGQFCDLGQEYRSAIFVHDAKQQRAAIASRDRIAREKKIRIVTEIRPAAPFYKAEEYHQDYYRKNPVRYRFYRFNCGRDLKLRQLWKS